MTLRLTESEAIARGLIKEDEDSSFPGVMKCSNCGRQAMGSRTGGSPQAEEKDKERTAPTEKPEVAVEEKEEDDMADEQGLLTQAQFAERHGVSGWLISKLVNDGTLTLTGRTLDPSVADAQFKNRPIRATHYKKKTENTGDDKPKRKYIKKTPAAEVTATPQPGNGAGKSTGFRSTILAAIDLLVTERDKLNKLIEALESVAGKPQGAVVGEQS